MRDIRLKLGEIWPQLQKEGDLIITSDFTYAEARTLLGHLGYTEDTRGRSSGLRVAFIRTQTKHIIRLHKPHQVIF